MKKTLSIIVTISFIFTLVLSTFNVSASSLETIVLNADTTVYAGNAVTNGWQAIYVPTANRTVENIKTDMLTGGDYGYNAKIPNASESNSYALIYLHPPQVGVINTADTYDIGLSFVVPKTGNYKLEFSGLVAGYLGTAASDGIKLLLYKNDFSEAIVDHLITDLTDDIDQDISLTGGDKLYFLFNKNGTHFADSVRFTKLSLSVPLNPFPTVEPINTPVVAGTTFNQFFNVTGQADQVAFWKTFYIDANEISELAKHTTEPRYVLPNKVLPDINYWATIWEGTRNRISAAQDFMIGDYFIAPVKGTINIVSNFIYEGVIINNNPATADGIGIAIYKNSFATVLKDREVFDEVTAGVGKDFNVNSINVEVGDKIIFLYDKNETAYSDSAIVFKKNIVYTAVDAPVSLFNPVAGKAVVDGNTLKALDSLTIGDFISSLGLTIKLSVIAYDSSNVAIPDLSSSVTTAAKLEFYTSGINNLAATYNVTTFVDTENATTDDTANEVIDDAPKTSDNNIAIFLVLFAFASAGFVFLIKAKKVNI